MIRATYFILGGLMVVLGGFIALELKAARMPAVGEATTPTNSRDIKMPATPTTADPVASWINPILARPLFAPLRRPPAAPEVATVDGTPPRLSGIMITSTEREAVFMPAAGPPIVAREGGHVGRLTVRSIEPDQVVVTGPRGIAILHMAFNKDARPSSAATPTPTPASPFSLFNGTDHPSGGIWTNKGKLDLPNAATWPGPPPLSRLPATRQTPASSPLLAPSQPPG